jgi:hypothetical protein
VATTMNGWNQQVLSYLEHQQPAAPEEEARPRDAEPTLDRPSRPVGGPVKVVTTAVGVQATEPLLTADLVLAKPNALTTIAKAKWLLTDLPVVIYDPTPVLADPLQVGDFLLWADPASSRAYFTQTVPQLRSLSLTVERQDDGGTIRTTGATASLTVGAYPADTLATMERNRQAWTDALAAIGHGRRAWNFQPLDFRTLRAALELPAEHLRRAVQVSEQPEAGAATFLVELTALGALAWQGALAERKPGNLQGVCKLEADYAQVGRTGWLVDVRKQVLSVPLGVLAAGVGPEAIQVVNPEVSVEARILVSGHPTVESVTLDMRSRRGGQSRNVVLGPEGGQLSLRLTGQDLSGDAIEWTAQVVYKSTRWPAIRHAGVLSSAGWAEVISPASWVQSLSFTAMLLDGAGNVVAPGSATSVDPANRVYGDLSFTASFLDGGAPLQTTFETSSQQAVTVYYPLPPNQPAGQMKLTVFALRAGRDDFKVRTLRPDETVAMAKVYANAHVELFTNKDASTEDSDESVGLGVLAALRAHVVPSPEDGRAPVITGPAAYSVQAGPPTFEVDPGDNPFWVVEVVTGAELFDTANNGTLRDVDNYYATDADSPGFLSGSSWTMPVAAWQRLRGGGALYYRVLTSASDSEWLDWQVSTPDELYFAAPSVRLVAGAAQLNADLRSLLGYLNVTADEFAPHEGRYFERLGELLADAGTDPGAALDQDNFREAVRAYQRRIGAGADGIPGQDTLWELQVNWANRRNLELVRVDADVWLPPGVTKWDPDRHGYDSFQLREDAVPQYNQLQDEVLAVGAVITSAGSFRDVRAAVTPGRSATSMHYSGLALDLSTSTGMGDPDVDPYIVTRDGDRWRVWARATGGTEHELDAVVWRNGATTTRRVRATVVDFTAMAARNGFSRIGPRSCFPGNYLCAEWWHFQCDRLLVPWISQFGIELLSLALYDQGDIQGVPDIWQNRKLIFRRSWR